MHGLRIDAIGLRLMLEAIIDQIMLEWVSKFVALVRNDV